MQTAGAGGVAGAANRAQRQVEGAARSPWLDRLARVGLAARGLVFALLGVLILQLVFRSGGSEEEASQSGAFALLAESSWGKAALWLVVFGFIGYGVWQLTEAAWGHQGKDGKELVGEKVLSTVKGVIYLVLAFVAFRTVMSGGSSGDSEQQKTWTAELLSSNTGRYVVGAIGVVIILVSVAVAIWGLRSKFEERLNLGSLSPGARSGVIALGKAGYAARGAVFAVLGVLVVVAAVRTDPSKAEGLDVALQELSAQPYGKAVLVAIALGLFCFAAYSLVETKLRRL